MAGASVAVDFQGIQGFPMRSIYLKDVEAKGGVNIQTKYVANLCMENVNFELFPAIENPELCDLQAPGSFVSCYSAMWTESSISMVSVTAPTSCTFFSSTLLALRRKKPAFTSSGELAIMPHSST